MADGTKWGLALLLACPACAGGFLVAVGAAAGITAALLKGTLLVVVLVLLAGVWLRGHLARRAEQRRGDGSCCEPTPPGVGLR